MVSSRLNYPAWQIPQRQSQAKRKRGVGQLFSPCVLVIKDTMLRERDCASKLELRKKRSYHLALWVTGFNTLLLFKPLSRTEASMLVVSHTITGMKTLLLHTPKFWESFGFYDSDLFFQPSPPHPEVNKHCLHLLCETECFLHTSWIKSTCWEAGKCRVKGIVLAVPAVTSHHFGKFKETPF